MIAPPHRALLLLAGCLARAGAAPTAGHDYALASAAPASESEPSTGHRHDLAGHRKLLSQSTTFCYLDGVDGVLEGVGWDVNCNDTMPVQLPCEVGGSPTALHPCALGDDTNGVDRRFARWGEEYAFDHCEEVLVYVVNGTHHHFCARLADLGDWAPRRREAAGGGVPESTGTSWWWCGWWGSGTQWHDGRCRATRRFLGEACWDDRGECDNGEHEPYSARHLSCGTMPSLGIATPTCIPSAFEMARNRCECGWLDWNLGFTCGANDGACHGHPCVLDTGGGDYSCDYHANNNW